MTVTVECQTRKEGSKPRALRREGFIPATLYGHKGAESTALTLTTKTAQTLLKNAVVNNTLVDLTIPEQSWKGKALIREVQAHPWKRTLYHLSFFAVAAQNSLQVSVPLRLLGESIGVKKGGVIEQLINELQVQCSAENIPEAIEIDTSTMDIGTTLSLNELVLPEGVSLISESDQGVLSVVAPKRGGATEETSEEAASEG